MVRPVPSALALTISINMPHPASNILLFSPAFVRPILPLAYFVHHRLSHLGDQLRRDLHAIPLLDLSGNIARRETVSREPQDLLIETRQARLIFLYQQGANVSCAVARDRDCYRSLFTLERLGRRSIPIVGPFFCRTLMLFIAQMGGPLSAPSMPYSSA